MLYMRLVSLSFPFLFFFQKFWNKEFVALLYNEWKDMSDGWNEASIYLYLYLSNFGGQSAPGYFTSTSKLTKLVYPF